MRKLAKNSTGQRQKRPALWSITMHPEWLCTFLAAPQATHNTTFLNFFDRIILRNWTLNNPRGEMGQKSRSCCHVLSVALFVKECQTFFKLQLVRDFTPLNSRVRDRKKVDQRRLYFSFGPLGMTYLAYLTRANWEEKAEKGRGNEILNWICWRKMYLPDCRFFSLLLRSNFEWLQSIWMKHLSCLATH